MPGVRRVKFYIKVRLKFVEEEGASCPGIGGLNFI